MSTLTLSGVNSRFLAPSRFPAFHLKRPPYFAYFENFVKMRSAHRRVEFIRLCNQPTVLCKANSLCKIVKWYVFCLFLLSPDRVGLDDVLQYQLRPVAVGKRRTPAFYTFKRFFVRSEPLFRPVMLTPMVSARYYR